ncbi:MAG: hypothetical protein VW741_01315 [Flammeovirgaceae bacterium]
MIKDSLNSLGAYIRLLILLVILINDSWAQILPSSFGVHHKKSSSAANYALSFDGNNYISTGGATLVANNYKLLYKSCSMCDYSIKADGASVSNTDNITFSSVAIQDGFYSIGSNDANL